MKVLTQSGFALTLLILASGTVLSQSTIRARTDSGKEVILSPDGTWKYAPVVGQPPPPTKVTISGGTGLFKPPFGGFGIRYDEDKWTVKIQADDRGTAQFKLKRGDAYAVIINEEIGIPTNSLRKIAIENAKEKAPDARVIQEEIKTINGKEVLMMKIMGTVDEIPFTFYGYYYGGKTGTIQLVTYTGQALFEKYEQDFAELLNGFEIY